MKPFAVEDRDFRISRWSKNNPKTCVAVAITTEGIALRNSNDPTKNTLYFTHAEWSAFLSGAKDGEFNLP